MSVEHIKKILNEFVEFPYSNWTSFLPESHSDTILQVGGDCIEINSRLQKVLEEHGYHTTMLVQQHENKFRRHHILVVTLPGENLPFYVDAVLGVSDPIEISNHHSIYSSFPRLEESQASLRLIPQSDSSFLVRYEFDLSQKDYLFDIEDSEEIFSKAKRNETFNKSRFYHTLLIDRETGVEYKLNFQKKRGLISIQVNRGGFIYRNTNTEEFERLFKEAKKTYNKIFQVNREFLHLRTDFDFTIDNLEKYFKLARG